MRTSSILIHSKPLDAWWLHVSLQNVNKSAMISWGLYNWRKQQHLFPRRFSTSLTQISKKSLADWEFNRIKIKTHLVPNRVQLIFNNFSFCSWPCKRVTLHKHLTIIPRARMDSESIAHEAREGRMGFWLKSHEGERNNCFSKVQLAGQTYRDKTTLAG